MNAHCGFLSMAAGKAAADAIMQNFVGLRGISFSSHNNLHGVPEAFSAGSVLAFPLAPAAKAYEDLIHSIISRYCVDGNTVSGGAFHTILSPHLRFWARSRIPLQNEPDVGPVPQRKLQILREAFSEPRCAAMMLRLDFIMAASGPDCMIAANQREPKQLISVCGCGGAVADDLARALKILKAFTRWRDISLALSLAFPPAAANAEQAGSDEDVDMEA